MIRIRVVQDVLSSTRGVYFASTMYPACGKKGHSLRKHKMKYLETGPVQGKGFKLFVPPE